MILSREQRMHRSAWKNTAFFGLLVSLLVLSAGGHIVSGDEETMFRVTQNLLTHVTQLKAIQRRQIGDVAVLERLAAMLRDTVEPSTGSGSCSFSFSASQS